MDIISFKSNKITQISIRVRSNTLNNLEKVTQNISKILDEDVSRNTIIEQMLEYAKNNAVFELNGVQYKFEDLIEYKKIGDAETIDNKSEPIHLNGQNSEDENEVSKV